MAYVASSEKLYSFGSGENGQLGNNKVVTVNGPVAVDNSWVTVNPESRCVVHRVASGGDHCYVLTSKNVSDDEILDLIFFSESTITNPAF